MNLPPYILPELAITIKYVEIPLVAMLDGYFIARYFA